MIERWFSGCLSNCLLCVRLLLFKKFLFSLSKIYPPYGGFLVENSQTGMVVNSYEKVHFHMKTLPPVHFVNFFVQIVQIVDTFLCILHYFMREKVYHTNNTPIHLSTHLSTMTSFFSIPSLLSTLFLPYP